MLRLAPETTGEIMTNRYRAFINGLALLCAVAVSAAQAQTPVPPPAPTPQQITPRPVPGRTVGLEPGKTVPWTMRDAILAALEHNPDIEIERSNVRQAQFDFRAAEGAYDPISTQGLSYTSTRQPNTRPFTGAQGAAITSQTLNFNFGHQGFIYPTGGDYSINFNNARQSLNFGLFTTEYSPRLSFSVRQPLWRNFRIDLNRRQIMITRKRLDLSDAQFRQRAIEIISRVQQAYWDLAFAIKDEEIQRDAVRLAETQLNNNQRQVEVGTLAPIDVVSAATELETRRQQVFQAMNAVAQAENTLKNLTVSGPNDELWAAQITPVESFEAQPVTLPLADAMRLAKENRPELKQFALQKDINQTDVDFFRNQTKPQIDLVASYNTFGVGGTPVAANNLSPSCGSPVTINGTPTCLSIAPALVNGQYVPVVNQTPLTFNPFVTDTFVGGYGTGLRNLFSNDFRQWSVGVNITLPWRNRTAKANLGRSLEVGRQIDLQTRRQVQTIEVEVRNAVQSVETARLRIDAARAARQYAEQQLDGEQKRFQAGLSTTFLVLTRQTQLSQARGTELRALTDYNKAVADLQRVISTTLSSNSVEVKSEPMPEDRK
jgi:outer membrane protein